MLNLNSQVVCVFSVPPQDIRAVRNVFKWILGTENIRYRQY